MADEITYSKGGTRVRVEGLRTLQRKLNKAGVDAQSQSELMHEIGMIVVRGTNPPVLSGALKGTIRAGKGKSKAVVRAGGAKAKYAGVQHYGWAARGIRAKPFLTDALHANHARVFKALEEGMEDLLKANGLK